MADFHKQVPALVAMHRVAADSCALGHPVKPDTHIAAVDQVVGDRCIHRRMQLYPGLFETTEELAHMDIVDDIPGDGAERPPVTTDNPRLATVGDVIVADEMTTHILPAPVAAVQYAFDGLVMRVVAVLQPAIVAVEILAEGKSGAAGMRNRVVFDHPPLAPVDANQPDLLSGRRRPWGCRLA